MGIREYKSLVLEKRRVCSSDVNDAEMFDVEPRFLVTDTELRLSLSEKKAITSREETLSKRALD